MIPGSEKRGGASRPTPGTWAPRGDVKCGCALLSPSPDVFVCSRFRPTTELSGHKYLSRLNSYLISVTVRYFFWPRGAVEKKKKRLKN